MSLKDDASSILAAALAAAQAGNAVRAHFQMPRGQYDRVVLVAAGKAAYSMAWAVEDVFQEQLKRVVVVTKHGHAGPERPRWEIIEAGHPIPDDNGVRASHVVRELAEQLGERDLLMVAISGGASSLLSAPAEPVTLQDKQRTTDLLLRTGANIEELNAVRKHLSFLKGGRLAALAHPARVISVLLSDVIGDRVDVIGSGPTAPDSSTLEDAQAVLRKYELVDQVPESVHTALRAGPETPKPGDAVFHRVENIVVGSNRLALEAAAEKAESLGYETRILSDAVQGEASEVARQHAAILKDSHPPACLLSGGETTVTVRGKGKGGRNQEFALTLACEIDQYEGRAVLCAGTDGTDGPTDAAGAFADHTTVERALYGCVDPVNSLLENDSYTFFDRLGDLIKTGPTGTNVMDINIMLARRS